LSLFFFGFGVDVGWVIVWVFFLLLVCVGGGCGWVGVWCGVCVCVCGVCVCVCGMCVSVCVCVV